MPSTTPVRFSGLAPVIQQWAAKLPDKVAIVHSGRKITYQELDTAAKQIAVRLLQSGLKYEDPVAVLTCHGADHIVAQASVLYAGGTCLPLDPALSLLDMQTRVDAAKVQSLITDETHQSTTIAVTSRFLITPTTDHGSPITLNDGGGEEIADVPASVQEDHRSHILFTSGTTGTPKAVQVPGRGILRLAHDPTCLPSPRSEVVLGHFSSVGFDASLIDIYGALLNGATVAVIDRQAALSPDLLAETIHSAGITSMFLTSSLFNIVALARPDAFEKMDTLMVGGESPGLRALQALFDHGPPRRIINGYGPTECCVFAVVHVVTRAEVQAGVVPIGKALHDTQTYVLDDDLKLVVGEGTGELHLGGIGLSRGYLDNEEKTRGVFLEVPGLGPEGEAIMVYRTGDIVERNAQGDMVWVGRKDREVKLRGFRVNLDVVEAELLATHLVRAAAAIKVQLPDQLSASLVACVSLKDRSISTTVLDAAVRTRLPTHMVPQLVVLDNIPLNRSGKIDRQRVSKDLVAALQRMQDGGKGILGGDCPDGGLTDTEKRVAVVWLRVLGTVPASSITRNSEFFALGATSLAVVALISEVRRTFDVSLTARAVYEHPSLGGLASVIEKKDAVDDFRDIELLREQCKRDAGLWSTITWSERTPRVRNWMAGDEGKVFITGATGFVGAFLLADLLALQEVKAVKCLVRSQSPDEGRRRLVANLEKYNLGECHPDLLCKLEIVSGDFSLPKFGLPDGDFASLAGWASIVYHLGAQVNYNQPYSAHRAANVLGTLQVLQFAVNGRIKPLHYTSSIAAYGPTRLAGRDVISENEPLTPFIESSVLYEGGYGQSQWVADEIVAALMRKGLPAAIYRLGFVLCHSKTGVGNPDDFVGRLLVDCVERKAYPLLKNQRKELLPVDYAASAILAISKQGENLGKAYHVIPDMEKALDLVDLFEMTASATGIDMRGMGYSSWVEKVKAGNDSACRLGPLVPMLEERVRGEQTRWELYEDMARLKSDNTARALKMDGGVQRVHVDEDVLRRYLHTLGLSTK